MIETVLLDLDDTILDFHAAEKEAIVRTMNTFSIDSTEKNVALYSEINAAQWKRLERGEMTRDEVLVHRFRLFLGELGVERDPCEMREVYEYNLGKGHLFVDGALDMLQTLSRQYSLFLVTNGTAKVQNARLQSAGILPYFKKIFISEQIGYVKPQKEFFQACFATIGEEKRAKTVIVGDSLTSDILGGINAGVRTVWFNPKRKPVNPAITPDRIIFNLFEFKNTLAQM